MKSTDHFKNTIKSYLDQRAEEDALFAVTYAKEGKNIDDCCTYILNQVQTSGCNGFTDDEVYGIAVHYYDEDKIDIRSKIDPGRVVVNHVVELTDQEKEEARKKAVERFQDHIIADMRKNSVKPDKTVKKKKEIVNQPSLFDL
jgi:hypothetical protein